MKAALFSAALPLMALSLAQGATIVWNFTDTNATVDSGLPTPGISISDISIGNSFGTVATPISPTSASSGYLGSTGTGNIGNAFRTGALNQTAGTGSGYFEFTITTSGGHTFSLNNFSFGVRSTATGAQSLALYSSQDGYATALFTVSVENNSTWALKDNGVSFTSATPDSAVTFRLYGYDGAGSATSGTVTTRLDDITMDVVANPVPEPSAAILGGLGLLALLCRRR